MIRTSEISFIIIEVLESYKTFIYLPCSNKKYFEK